MKDLPYFRWWVARAETDERYAGMTDEELGFYHRCLNKSWINVGLPADHDSLARMMRVERSYFDRIWVEVGKCWHINKGRYFSRTQEEERKHATSKSASASKAVRTRYERRTNELPRALAQESESESETKLNIKTSLSSNAATSMPMPPATSEFPLTIAEIRKHDPAVDEVFVRGLVGKTVQYCLSSPQFPDDKINRLTDSMISKLVRESYNTGPPGHRTGLLLSRVPPIAVTWAQE
jgi:uncharacterized protein YdaU (DUF1376 family)